MDSSKKNTYIAAGISLLVIIFAVYFLFIRSGGKNKIDPKVGVGEVKQVQDLEIDKRPYVTLTPTSDGAEIIISIENMGHFDGMEYELTYLADNPQVAGEKLQRGATGTDVNTKDEKYKKSTLLGTASKGVRSPDKGIEDGKLVLHMFKGDDEYLSETNWDLLEAGATAQELESWDGNFKIEIPSLGKNYFIIIADTVGVPKVDGVSRSEVLLPVYGTFSVAPTFKSSAEVTIKAQSEKEQKLYLYNHSDSTSKEAESLFGDSQITASVDSFATFVIVSK